MTSDEKRAKVAAQAAPAIGRNGYSQQASKRECVFTPYKDGKFYSDCSSFVRKCYQKADVEIKNIGGNTIGILLNKNAVEVDCNIKSGIPKDVDALRVGDLLLFAGSDTSRAYAQYVGHVEMVYSISGSTVTLVGHGSGKPSKKNMVSYCRSRQAAKTKTRRGNRGLIKVVRFIPDEAQEIPDDDGVVSGNVKVTAAISAFVRAGSGRSGKPLGIVMRGDLLERSGEDTETWIGVKYKGVNGWISANMADVVD